MTRGAAAEPRSTSADGELPGMHTSEAADELPRRRTPRRKHALLHRRHRRGMSLAHGFITAGCAYLLLGATWFALWWIAGEPTGVVREVWGAALIAPLAAVEALLARRMADRSLWRYALAQAGVLIVGLAAAWVGTVGGVLLAWFVVWTAFEPRVIGFVGFWWTVRAVTWPWAHRRWTAVA